MIIHSARKRRHFNLDAYCSVLLLKVEECNVIEMSREEMYVPYEIRQIQE